MKKLAFTIIAAAALVLPLCAQRASTDYVAGLRADIPFEFIVQNTTVPPGEYVIKLGSEAVTELVGSDRKYFIHTNADSPYTGSHAAMLIFHQCGNRYFLSQIRSSSTSRDLPIARAEREFNKKTPAAARPNQTEIVLAMR